VVLHLKQPSKGHHGIFDGRRNDMTRTIQCGSGTGGEAARAWETIHRLQRELGSGGGGGGGSVATGRSGGGGGGGSFQAGAGATGESSLDGWEGGFDGDDLNNNTTTNVKRHQAPPPDEAAAAWDAAGNIPDSPSNRPPTLPCLDYRLVWDSGASSDGNGNNNGVFPSFPFTGLTGGGGGGGFNAPPRATIWEPVSALPDYVALGHVVEPGPDPPGSPVAVYFHNPNNPAAAAAAPLLARPLRYELVWRRTSDKGNPLTLWNPVAPAGYVAVGSVAVSGSDQPPSQGAGAGAGAGAGVGWCVREDAVRQAEFFTGAAWTSADNGGGGGGGGVEGGGGGVTLFQVDNDAFTFVATRGGDADRSRPAAHIAVAVDATKMTTTTPLMYNLYH
jgi:hypothetical protein